MKNLAPFILSTVTFLFLGCEDIVIGEDAIGDNLIDGNISIHNGALPVIKSPVGSYVDLSEYFYPEDLSIDKTFYFNNVYSYSQSSSNIFTKTPDFSIRSYTKSISDDITRVTEYKDGLQQKYDDIKRYKILSYEKDKISKEYPVRVAQNSKVLDFVENKIQTVCMVVSIEKSNLELVLPLYVRNDMKNRVNLEDGNFKSEQFNFDNVIHIYCGTSDNHTIDSYYSKKYGKVLEVKKDIDKNLLKVEVVDVLSVKN
jgi:hypothetical protein